MGLFGANGGHSARKRLTPPRGTPDDLAWWQRQLRSGPIKRELRGPAAVVDVAAFSDASSGVGIAVVIGGWWRAWRLVPGWKTERRDIQWAEAIGFELLCWYAFRDAVPGTHLKIWGDNSAVVEGWWKGRSGNPPVNSVFRRLGEFLDAKQCGAVTRYVESARNPADDPSRGIYGPGTPYPFSRLLPPVTLPDVVAPFVVDWDAELTAAERAAPAGARRPEPKCIDLESRSRRRDVVAELDRAAADLAAAGFDDLEL